MLLEELPWAVVAEDDGISDDVLCPVALDDSWKSKLENESANRALWRTLTDKMILDFSKWNSKAFATTFEKLVRGLKKNYPPNA